MNKKEIIAELWVELIIFKKYLLTFDYHYLDGLIPHPRNLTFLSLPKIHHLVTLLATTFRICPYDVKWQCAGTAFLPS